MKKVINAFYKSAASTFTSTIVIDNTFRGSTFLGTANHPSPVVLFEQCFEYIAQSECRAAIDTVVQGFLGMQDTHAPFAITRNQRSLDSSLRLPRRPCADASLDRRLSESEFHRRSFLYILLTKANIRLIFQSRISVMMIFRTNLSNSLCKPYS